MYRKYVLAGLVSLLLANGIAKSEDDCCGYSSPGNPYLCYVTGNCTWWAWHKRPDLPGWGDAKTWLASAESASLSTGSDPIVGSIACFNDMYPPYGHVAYVESVNPDGSFYVSEMGYDSWDCLQHNPYSAGEASGFIYGGPTAYSCSFISQSITPSGPYLPGQIVQGEVIFRNEGAATWSNTAGANYVELASCDGDGNPGESFFNFPCDFEALGWLNCIVPSSMNEESVPPGGTATFTFRGRIPEDATPGPHLVYFGPFYNGNVIPGWGQMHYPVDVKATGVWLASPIYNNCNGPLVDGRWWYDEFFNESNWTQVAVPVSGFGCNACDRFFRYRYNYVNQDKTVKVYFASDDGLTLYVNGLYIGGWGSGCHGGGCVNNVPWSCGSRANVPAIDITTFLHPGYNQIAVHVTEGSGGEYFNFSFSEEDLSTQLTGSCCLGEACLELGDEYTAANCIGDGGQIYSGLQYDCGQHSPCVDKGSKVVSDPVLFFNTSLPLPTLPAQLEFTIVDTLAHTAYYILPEELGGQTIFISDFSGTFVVTAVPSGNPDTVNLTIDEYNFIGASVSLNGNETGTNYIYLDSSSEIGINGHFTYSSGRIELVVPSIIVNDIFPQDNPVRSRSYIRGAFNMNTGTLKTVSQAYNVLPAGCCIGPTRGNVDCEGIIDISDVTMMIQKMFITLGEFCCEAEADMDQSDLVDIGDLTMLISSLFITLNPLPECP